MLLRLCKRLRCSSLPERETEAGLFLGGCGVSSHVQGSQCGDTDTQHQHIHGALKVTLTDNEGDTHEEQNHSENQATDSQRFII